MYWLACMYVCMNMWPITSERVLASLTYCTCVLHGGAHAHVLFQWIICTRMLFRVREGFTCMCGRFINVHTLYKTLIMYLNEYNLAWKSLRRNISHHCTISSQGTYSTNITSGYSKWASYIMWEVKKFHFVQLKKKLSWHPSVDWTHRQISNTLCSLWVDLWKSNMWLQITLSYILL